MEAHGIPTPSRQMVLVEYLGAWSLGKQPQFDNLFFYKSQVHLLLITKNKTQKQDAEQARIKWHYRFFCLQVGLPKLHGKSGSPWASGARDTHWFSSSVFGPLAFPQEAACKCCFLTMAQSQLLSKAEVLPTLWVCCLNYWIFGWL